MHSCVWMANIEARHFSTFLFIKLWSSNILENKTLQGRRVYLITIAKENFLTRFNWIRSLHPNIQNKVMILLCRNPAPLHVYQNYFSKKKSCWFYSLQISSYLANEDYQLKRLPSVHSGESFPFWVITWKYRSPGATWLMAYRSFVMSSMMLDNYYLN